MNEPLATTALRALTAPGFATESGYCWRWTRQCIMACYGLSEPPSYHRGSAKAAAYAMLEEGKAHRYNGEPSSLEIGDILLKTNGEHGHVGILTHRGIAENSSFHWRRHPGDARGLRSLEQFGAFSVVGRLKPPVVAPSTPPQPEAIKYLLQDVEVPSMQWRDNTQYAPLSEIAAALEAAKILKNPVSLTDALTLLGYEIAAQGDHREERRRFYNYVKAKAVEAAR